jgi:hypothetical protein
VPSAKSLAWIHLSDLHFGHGREAALRFGQKVVMHAILRDAVRPSALVSRFVQKGLAGVISGLP